VKSTLLTLSILETLTALPRGYWQISKWMCWSTMLVSWCLAVLLKVNALFALQQSLTFGRHQLQHEEPVAVLLCCKIAATAAFHAIELSSKPGLHLFSFWSSCNSHHPVRARLEVPAALPGRIVNRLECLPIDHCALVLQAT